MLCRSCLFNVRSSIVVILFFIFMTFPTFVILFQLRIRNAFLLIFCLWLFDFCHSICHFLMLRLFRLLSFIFILAPDPNPDPKCIPLPVPVPQHCMYGTSIFSWKLSFLRSGTVAQRTVSSEWTSTWVGASTSINSKSCSPPSSLWAASFKVTSSAASSNRKRAHSFYSSFNIFNLFAKNGTGSYKLFVEWN